ncbi:hypothetical protein [Streptomyces sp. NPDC006289]|uniref:hypothetical protein n=1 Tax=Streptomyces sp. NPDC006289 TaxID=3156744 RepID=UPI00339F9AE5
MPERVPAQRIAPQGLLKRRRTEANAAAAPAPQGVAPRPATPRRPPPASGRVLRLPVSPLPAALLPLPEGFDLAPGATTHLADPARNPKRWKG